MAQDNNEKLTVTVKQLAKMLNCGTTTAYRLVKEKSFPSKRIFGKWVIPLESVREWLRKD